MNEMNHGCYINQSVLWILEFFLSFQTLFISFLFRPKKDLVSGGIRTHALKRGPEHSADQLGKITLESGSLDQLGHTDIYTLIEKIWQSILYLTKNTLKLMRS